MTENQLLDLAQQAGIPTDSAKLEALKLKYLHGLSDYEVSRRTGIARQTVRYAVQKVEWARGVVIPPRIGLPRFSPTADKLLTAPQLDALCDLAGRIGDGVARKALHHFYVEGKTQAASALLANTHVMTLSNARRRIEMTQLRLPALAETVRRAQG